MIEFKQVEKTYQTSRGRNHYQALKGIDLKIDAGETVAIVGPSGSGKSTIMNIMGLLDQPTSGYYTLKQRDTSQLSSNERAQFRAQEVGFVFQSFNLLPRLTAVQNVALPSYYVGQYSKSVEKKSLELLEKLGMKEFSEHKPDELSGGQQQRVAIARSLINNPSIILADEPTGALDTEKSMQIIKLLFGQRGGATVVIVTHDERVAKQCERMIYLRDGVVESVF